MHLRVLLVAELDIKGGMNLKEYTSEHSLNNLMSFKIQLLN